MMNLRENDEKCFMSNNRKYISLSCCFFLQSETVEKTESVQKNIWESVSRKKIISQRHNNTVFMHYVKDTCSLLSVSFFPLRSAFSGLLLSRFVVSLCSSSFGFFSSLSFFLPRSARLSPSLRFRFWLLLINCYFYDFMLTRTRDTIVINVQSSWISCSSMKFLSIWGFMTLHGCDAHSLSLSPTHKHTRHSYSLFQFQLFWFFSCLFVCLLFFHLCCCCRHCTVISGCVECLSLFLSCGFCCFLQRSRHFRAIIQRKKERIKL